jgi:pimeloyl-ACP methyl ester carboxylesterase
MRKQRDSWLFLGMTVGLAAALLQWSRRQRLALARRADKVMQQAIHELNDAVPGAGAQSIFLTVGERQIHTIVAGPEDGLLVVLLHGFPENWYSWRKQIPALVEQGYRVVVPDQRGYNLTDKPKGVRAYQIDELASDVLGVIHAFEREQAVIVAHDWGGAVAWRFAMDYPEAVDRLIVMNAPHPKAFNRELKAGWEQRRKSWYMFFFQMPWLPEALMTLSPQRTAKFFFQKTAVRPAAFSGNDLEVMAVALAQPGAMPAMVNWYRAAFRYPSTNPNVVIDVPTLLIWGEDDVALGKPLTYGLEEWVTDLEVHYIPNCGHWVQNEAVQEVNAAMLAFLR